MKPANAVFSKQGTTIFTVMSALARDHGAVDLGQGYPDGEGPPELRAAAARYVMEGPNQYPPMMGVVPLRRAIAAHDARFYGLKLDWQTETLVTSGATEALAAALMGLLNPGDEAVVIEPVYDSYRPLIEAMGAQARPVRLNPPAWSFDEQAFAAAFTDKTKLLVLNSPMNPIGKVFTREELNFIAETVLAHDAYVVCDEVYEHLVFDADHIPLMTLPGMAARCVRIGSAGKTFSVTGWKIGLVTAQARLMNFLAKTHQFITFTVPPALQLAVAEGLGKEDAFFAALAQDLYDKKQRLAGGLAAAGFDVLPTSGTYFMTADITPLAFSGSDVDFCGHITAHAGVTAIPVSAFYADPTRAPSHLVRFCFCKEEAVLDDACARLKRYFG